MAVEQYANLAQDQLNGGIDNVVVSLDLDDASEFPATGNFRILIDSELLICTARTSNTLTVVRGQEGTVAASHSDNAIVTLVATAGSILAVGSAIHRSDVVASRPAAGLEGRLFFPTAGRTIDRDNGTLWTPYGPTYTLKEPIDGDFAWINQGGASVDMSEGGILLLAPAGTGGLRIRKKTAPATPYTITVAFIPHMSGDPAAFPGMGPLFRKSGTGELVTFSYTQATTVFARPQKWNSPTSFNNGYVATWDAINNFLTGDLVWMQISDNGTNLIFRVSNDGKNWYQTFSVSRTDFLSGGPDEVGFWGNATASYDTALWLLHWSES
jgi:hypothetical protein